MMNSNWSIFSETKLKNKGAQSAVTKNTVGRTFQPTKCLVHSSQCEVAVIGAGPYGLSAGAHLKAKGISARVLANRWSSGPRRCRKACCCGHRGSRRICLIPVVLLEAYESASKTAPSAPVPLDTFVEYGRWFRHQLGSDLDERTVLRLDSDEPGFRLTLGDGEEYARDEW
jgi:FAD-dependent urate hydroxylase